MLNKFSVADRPIILLTSWVYFVQGALGISAIAFPLFLRNKGWSISEIATFSFVIGLPWTLKILYGAVTDGARIGGRRRQPYLVLSSILSIGAWLGLAFFPEQPTLIYLFAVLANFGFAMTDVVTDALVVEHSTETTTQLFQSLSWGFRSLGAILGGFVGGWLAQHTPFAFIFGLTALLPLATLVTAFLIHEIPDSGRRSLDLIRPVFTSLKSLVVGNLRWFALLFLVLSFSSSFSTPYFFFLKETLNFNETFLGILSSLSWMGAIVGCWIYGQLLRKTPIKKTLSWAIGLNTLNVLTTLLILNRWTAVSLFFIGGILGYLTLLPLMATAAVLSRQKGVEGSLFALLMSLNNLGQVLSIFIGGRLFDIIGLPPLILLSAGVGLVGFFFVSKLKGVEEPPP